MPMTHRPEITGTTTTPRSERPGGRHCAEVWHACEADRRQPPRGPLLRPRPRCPGPGPRGGMADPSAFEGYEVDQELAVGVLVSQRPGSWEATHVRDLTFPVDLLGAPEDIAPE